MGPWQHCSVTCGDQGTRKRTVLCVRQLGPDQQIALEDWQCEDLDRPAHISACQRQQPCPPERGQWRTGPWSDVSVTDNPRRVSLRVTPVFTARRYASALYAVCPFVPLFVRTSVRLFVRLSVTSRHCTKTAKYRIMQTTPNDSPGTLVFPPKNLGEIPTGSPKRGRQI